MDIKIIGAGPGGLITGLGLIEAGFEPTLYEKNEEIVSTLCAEGLSADTLARVPFGPWERYAKHTFEHATFIFPSGQKAYISKRCHTMDRTSWFRAMAREFEKRGGTIVLGEEITPEKLKGMKYDILVDASGPLSWIARQVVGNTMRIKPGVQYRMRIDYDYDGMEFFLDKRYSDEYSWIFMKGEGANVGLLGRLADLERFIKDKNLDGEILKKEGYSIPFFGTRMQKGNILLMGDAAGMTNPLTKGGMACCVFAAEILAECAREGKISEYEQRLKAHPVLAPEYMDALDYFQSMTNQQLDRFGSMINGMELSRLPARMKALFLFAAMRNFRKMRRLMKAMHYAKDYSW